MPNQIITAADASVTPGGIVELVVEYSTIEPEAAPADGVNFRIHYDSSQLSFESYADIFSFGAQPEELDPVPSADTDDLDGDPNTDRFLTVAYVDPDLFAEDVPGNWPFEVAETQPVSLFTARFIASEDIEDTAIGFTLRAVPRGFDNLEDEFLSSTLIDVNEPPIFGLPSFAFTIPTDSPVDTVVGTVTASDPEGDPLNFSITEGNPDPDGDGIAVLAIAPETGIITVADADDLAAAPFSLTVAVSDGFSTVSTEATVSLADGEPPVFDEDAFSFQIAENSAAGTVVGTLTATDADSETFTFALTGGNLDGDGDGTGAFAIAPETGEITVADADELDFETTPSFELTAVVTDPEGLADTASVTVNLDDINEAPSFEEEAFVFEAIAAQTAAEGDLVGTAAATDPDAGDTLTFAIASGNEGEAFAIDPATGEITVAAPAQLTQNFELEVTVTDSGDLQDTATVTIPVDTPDNDPPEIVNGGATFTIPETAAAEDVVGTVEAIDPDGDTLSFAIADEGNPDADGDDIPAFAIAPETGIITVADPDELAADEFALTVTVSDDGEPVLSDSAEFFVAVERNQPPTTVGIEDVAALEDADPIAIDLTAAFSDPDGDELAFAVTNNTNPALLAAVEIGEDGVLTLTLAENAFGSAELTVEASDGSAAVETSFTLDVEAVNDPPALELDESFAIALTSEAGTVVGTAVGSDVDGDDLSFSISEGNPNPDGDDTPLFEIDSNGVITVADSDDLSVAAFELTVSVTDGQETATAQTTVNVIEGEPPVFDPESFAFSLDENSAVGTVVGTLTATDADSETFTFALTGGNLDGDGDGTAAFAIAPETGEITVADADELDFETTPSFELTAVVTDSEDLTDTAAVTVDLNDLNEAPAFAEDIFSFEVVDVATAEDGDLVGTVVAIDPEGDALSFEITAGDDSGAFEVANDGQITIADAAQLTQSFELTVTVTEDTDDGFQDTATVIVPVDLPGNDAPQITNGGTTFTIPDGTVDGDAVGTVEAIDPDGDTLSFSLADETNPDTDEDGILALTIDSETGVITVDDADDLTGENFTLTASVSDGELSDTASFVIAFEGAIDNQPPTTAGIEDVSALEDADPIAIDLAAAFSDPDGDELTFAIDNTNADLLTAEVEGTTLTLTLAANAFGSSEVTVTASDGTDSVETRFAVEVAAVNDAPTTTGLAAIAALEDDAPIAIDLAAAFSDIDGDDLTFTVNNNNADLLSAGVEGATLTLTPIANAFGSSEVTVTASDGTDSVEASFAVNVAAVNDAPTTAGIEDVSVEEDAAPIAIDLAAAFSDIDGDDLTFTVNNSNADLLSAGVEGATLTLTPIANAFGSSEVTVTASDGTDSVEASFAVNVAAVNDAPEFLNAGAIFNVLTTDLPGTVVGTVEASDPEGDTLSFALAETGNPDADDDGTRAFAIDANSGAISVADEDELLGVGSFPLSVTVTDSGEPALAATADYTIAVGAGFGLDVDGNQESAPFQDGLIIFRFLAELAPSTFDGAIGEGATRDSEQIADFLELGETAGLLDADGNGDSNPFQDGLITFRFLADLAPETYEGAIGPNATRSVGEIQDFLEAIDTTVV